jgi:hypothetical protein
MNLGNVNLSTILDQILDDLSVTLKRLPLLPR